MLTDDDRLDRLERMLVDVCHTLQVAMLEIGHLRRGRPSPPTPPPTPKTLGDLSHKLLRRRPCKDEKDEVKWVALPTRKE